MEQQTLDELVKVKVKLLSCVRLFATPWTVAYQASPSMGFSRQEYRSGSPFPSPADLPDPGIELESPALQEDSLSAELPGKPNRIQCNTSITLHSIIILEKAMATHSSTLAWKIPWMEKPGRLQSMRSLTVGHN